MTKARRLRSLALTGASAAVIAAALPPSALGEFPYPAPTGDPSDYSQYRLPPGPGHAPNDLQGKLEWMYAATPEPGNEPENQDRRELGGVRGAHLVDDADVATGWQTTTGRPDVTIAVLDSGIKWNDPSAMRDLREKTRLSRGELPQPRVGRAQSLEDGVDCGSYRPPGAAGPGEDPYDVNEDGVFNVLDYACDGRVERDPAARAARGQPRGVGPADLLDPQDVLIPFTDGIDDDSNGFRDDIVGWDFLDDDNDPYDDVQYGHGTGEANDSTAEADNAAPEDEGELGTCPNCMAIHMRVGDSFIADENRFAQAVIYAVDNGALVVQEALGTLNHTRLGRDAVEYAYDRGVAVIASAADEAAQHHNWPSTNPHVILVNSVTKYDDFTHEPSSYLQFNGCTNFSSKVTVAIPSVSCSSDATGRASGMAGLIYSAALNAAERQGTGQLEPHPTCRRPDREPCVISVNEVRQLMASGTVGGEQQADDVNFARDPLTGEPTELACFPDPTAACTDPNLNSPNPTPLVLPFPATKRYAARGGHDQFYGWGRVNMRRALDAVDPSATREQPAAPAILPEVEIEGPDWFRQISPDRPSFALHGYVAARGTQYTCRVLVAPGSMPRNIPAPGAPDGDFVEVPSACDGGARSGPIEGVLAHIDVETVKGLFPEESTGDFRGPEPGAPPSQQTSNGRPNSEPYGFTVKVVAQTTRAGTELTGEDRRNLYLHRDRDMLPGFPRYLRGDGEASPLLVDLDGDNRNELVVATADGLVHAYERRGGEVPGWPVRADSLSLHTGGRAFRSGAVLRPAGAPFVASPAAADLDRDGAPEVVAADFEGDVYAWDADGDRVFHRQTRLRWSGKPLQPFVDVRQGKRNRTQRGFLASPVLADLDLDRDLEIVAAAMDRHVYAWHHTGRPVRGFPTIVVDPDKVASIDPRTHQVDFNQKAGSPLNQGAIVDTPAVGDMAGDRRPEIVVGTNEEYLVNEGNEGDFNAGRANTASISLLAETGLLKMAHGRLYALEPTGDPDGRLLRGPPPFLRGWPVKIGRLFAEILPVVGEGITGAPVIGPADCPDGGPGPKVGTIPDAGVGYILNPDGDSCFGKDPTNGKDIGLQSDVPQGPETQDSPAYPAVGHPAFGDLDGTGDPDFLAPTAGLRRALDLGVREYQQGGQDFLSAWDPSSTGGQFKQGWPSVVNDLQFLTGPSVADIDGQAGEEAVAGTANLDLTALNAAGQPAGDRWPKLTSDWTVANPVIGSWGTRDTAASARKVVVSLTRSGTVLGYSTEAPACSPGSWPRFHHDNASSGFYGRDAVSPGRPMRPALQGRRRLTVTAPGDDLLCGRARRYQAVTADTRITGDSFVSARRLRVRNEDGSRARPTDAGTRQTVRLVGELQRFVAIRAVDEQGGVGRPAVLRIGRR